MRAARKLLLTKERLTDLTPAELGAVAGGRDTVICPTDKSECQSLDGRCLVSNLIDPCLTGYDCTG